MGFDTVYAMSDLKDDLRVGVKSSAIFFGDYVVGAIFVSFAIAEGLLAWLGWDMHLGYIYLISCAIAAGAWLWQCIQLWQPEPPSSIYQRIFGQNVWIGFIVLAGMLSAAIEYGN
jgi:4-hydroxybenzoate polyprenyltransferase